EGIKLYPVNFHHTGRSAANETFLFAVNFYEKITDGSIARVPCDFGAGNTLVGMTRWHWIRIRTKDRFCGRAGGRPASSITARAWEHANQQSNKQRYMTHVT